MHLNGLSCYYLGEIKRMSLKVIASGAFNLLIRRCTGPFLYRRQWLKKTQWLPKDELADIQLALLKKIVLHAERYVPYYQKIMKEKGFTSADIRSLEDIQLFPVLTKKDIIEAGDDLVSRSYPRKTLRLAYTGGTTGTPVKIYRSPFSIGTEHAFVRRQWDWAGIKLSDRAAFLTGRVIVPPDQTEGDLWAYDPFMKELILSTYHLTGSQALNYIKAMKSYKIKALVGYPSAVSFLARVCIDSGLKLNLKAVLTSSETLTDSMRSAITEAFSCPVFDYFGSAERVSYIFTCEKGNYHVQSEYGITEFIPDGDSGTCKVVSTGFWNKAMPFIRYDMGDTVVASSEQCSCLRAFPVIKKIAGRQADVIKTPSGREFGAAILTHLLYGTDHILESQIVQDRLDHLFIDYVPGERFSTQDLKAFEGLIRHHLPTELTVEFRAVNSISRTSSGKIKPVVSKIPGNPSGSI